MAELADAHDSKSCTARCEGSSPSFGTNTERIGFFKAIRWDARSAWHIVSDFENRCELGKIKAQSTLANNR